MSSNDILQPLSVFCSYSHRDEELQQELDKHLSPLKRLGQVRTWHDREIGAGKEWRTEIDQNLKNADIILLLISADFIASEYCYGVEADLAMSRHAAGQATVIPVMLRPVDVRGLPFGELQMLPKDGLPIAKWNSRDEALKNVAEGIRDAVGKVVERRVREFRSNSPSAGSVTEARALDAAVATVIPIGESREVVALVRTSSSEGLELILAEELGQYKSSSYSCKPADVKSEGFSARYTITAADEIVPPEYRLNLYAPDLIIEDLDKKFFLEPIKDSMAFKFLIKARTEGEYRLRVNLFSRDWSMAETLLKTTAKTGHRPGGGASGIRASVDFVVRAIAKVAATGGQV